MEHLRRLMRWEQRSDQLIKDLIGDGDVSHLPAAGKPLELNDDAHIPREMQAAAKIMSDHNVIPDWIASSQALEAHEDRLRRRLARRAARYRRELGAAQGGGAVQSEAAVKESWRRYTEKYAAQIERYNREVRLYNLKVPAGIAHRQLLSSAALIKRALES